MANESELVACIRESDRLYEILLSYDYCSEDFWKTHDELVQILYRGIDIALRIGNESQKVKFRERLEDLKSRVPSGYWK